jgi:hypothetical protein
MRAADVRPDVWEMWMDIVSSLSPAEKIHKAMQLTEEYREEIRRGLREHNPKASECQILLGVARIVLGFELFDRAYGDEAIAAQ